MTGDWSPMKLTHALRATMGVATLTAMLTLAPAISSHAAGGNGYPLIEVPPGYGVATMNGNPTKIVTSVESLASVFGPPPTIVTISLSLVGVNTTFGGASGGNVTIDKNGHVTLDNGTVLDFSGSGLEPGTVIYLQLFSRGIAIGKATVAANGTYSVAAAVPPGLGAGNHTIVFQGTSAKHGVVKFGVGVRVVVPRLVTVGPFVVGHSLSSSLTFEVQNLAAVVKAHHFHHVLLTGYTDNQGSASLNRATSVLRAKSVAAQLRADLAVMHVTGVSIATRGLGSTHPQTSNKTAKGRLLNRRVVATLS